MRSLMNLSACSTALTLGLHASLYKLCMVYRYNGSFNMIGWNDWIGGLDRTHLPVNTQHLINFSVQNWKKLHLYLCPHAFSHGRRLAQLVELTTLVH